tara:strand:+ start:468 stop:629 length:162 start_codon:yes stop_codon:yes gene_type:complete
MSQNQNDNQEKFMIGPVFENVIVTQCKEMKKLLGCEDSYIREFLMKIADKYFL